MLALAAAPVECSGKDDEVRSAPLVVIVDTIAPETVSCDVAVELVGALVSPDVKALVVDSRMPVLDEVSGPSDEPVDPSLRFSLETVLAVVDV